MSDKLCFITGSGSHNGRTIALRMADLGYDVVLHHSGRDPKGAEEVRDLILSKGRQAWILVQDLSKPHAAEDLFRRYREQFDHLDLFINNAGVTVGQMIPDMTEEKFDLCYSVDLRAAAFCIREAGLFMREKGIRGSIVVISSNHHDRIWLPNACYGSIKEGLCRFVKYAAIEFIRDGIRINAIAPGYIDWQMEDICVKTPEKQAEVCRTEIPAHRFVTSSEIADWIDFISGPAGLSLTGQTIDLDGGVSLLSDSMDAYGLVPEK